MGSPAVSRPARRHGRVVLRETILEQALPRSGLFEAKLSRNAANHVALSPLSFLARTAAVHPDRMAVIYGPHRTNWAQTYARCRRLASALALRGVDRGDTVAVMAPNVPALFEAHFGIPMLGAVLSAINVRADVETVAYILEHGEAKQVLVDAEFAGVMREALARLPAASRPGVIDIADDAVADAARVGDVEYEALLVAGDPNFAWSGPPDEWDSIALNYTSGTTGNPKGVVYHHRGAYLNAIGNALTWEMPRHPVYLWTLPMFHCNGWCFPWTVTMLAGTHVCLRKVEPRAMLEAMDAHGVTHLCGAPIVMGILINAPETTPREPRVKMMTAGAAPPAAVIGSMERLGFDVTHTYGLTEVYGPITVCEWKSEWNDLGAEERASIRARQGVPYAVQEDMTVVDADGVQVPKNGATLGELLLRGNVVMKGYLKNPGATAEALRNGWFHTGDLAVLHPDGYAEIRDRAKDLVISGGENISTIEVENVLYHHPAVLEAAVVARPDEKWGETPCAFVMLKPDMIATEADLIAFVRSRIAHYKAPRSVIFGPLPKTSTGKMQKYLLRQRARTLNGETTP
jgi:fatty-acyl-CoA synthase